MISSETIIQYLDELYPDARCELNYTKDYELLLATILSAQSTDKRVNLVTKELFKYDLKAISNLPISKIEQIIKPVGTYQRKASYIKEVACRLLQDYDGVVPCERDYLESLPGVGRKTTNVVLANIYNVPALAVDTHVNRVSKRLGLAKEDDDVLMVEKKLMRKFPKDKWNRLHHQLVLFGRYKCKSQRPLCEGCKFQKNCKHYQGKTII